VAFIFIGVKLTQQTPEITLVSQHKTLAWFGQLLVSLNEANPLYVTNKILPGYANNPSVLLVILAVLVALMLLRSTFKKHLINIGNAHWNRAPYNANKVNSSRFKANFVHRLFLKFAHFIRSRKLLNKHLVPSLYAKIIPILMTALLLFVILYLLFEVADVLIYLIQKYG
jgi:hypothetical protein